MENSESPPTTRFCKNFLSGKAMVKAVGNLWSLCGKLFFTSIYFSLFLFFYALAKCRGLSMLLFCLPRKVTKRVHSRTTFLRISLTCRFKRAAARVQNGMLLHLTWYALTNRKVVSFDTDNMVL